MLHILNGKSTEDTLRQSSIPGEFFSFRDALISGPVPTGATESVWRSTRAAYLSQTYNGSLETIEQDLLRQSETLASFRDHDEVALWFEHDLFCHLNLIYLLSWFSQVKLESTRLSLINIGAFPGKPNFRGLGELNPEELAGLFTSRESVATDQIELASRAWAAFCSADPTAIEELLATDTSALPFLSRGFSAHLRRFPSTKNGLGRIENKSLELISQGHESFSELFLEFLKAEAIYGLGDAQVWFSLVGLATAKEPLVSSENGSDHSVLTNSFPCETKFKLTDRGRSVLNGEVDFLTINEIDEWLGGVHLQGHQVWRWDDQEKKLRYC